MGVRVRFPPQVPTERDCGGSEPHRVHELVTWVCITSVPHISWMSHPDPFKKMQLGTLLSLSISLPVRFARLPGIGVSVSCKTAHPDIQPCPISPILEAVDLTAFRVSARLASFLEPSTFLEKEQILVTGQTGWRRLARMISASTSL